MLLILEQNLMVTHLPTTATNVVGGANRIPYNNATNQTTTDGDLQFNGNKLTVKDLDVTGTFDCKYCSISPHTIEQRRWWFW